MVQKVGIRWGKVFELFRVWGFGFLRGSVLCFCRCGEAARLFPERRWPTEGGFILSDREPSFSVANEFDPFRGSLGAST